MDRILAFPVTMLVVALVALACSDPGSSAVDGERGDRLRPATSLVPDGSHRG